MSIICSGSLAFDRLSKYPGVFSDHLLAEHLSKISVCFLVDDVKRHYGGTAGNIAYNLSLMEEKAIVVATIGNDSDGNDYLERLRSLGLSTDAIGISETLSTAGCYIASDDHNNQIAFFSAGATLSNSPFETNKLDMSPEEHLAIVSPGGAEDMKRLCRQYRELGIKFIFDPGQQIPVFSKEQLLDMLEGSYILITNEYEINLFLQITGLKEEDLFQYTQVLIITKGIKGSELITPRYRQHISLVPERVLVNPTGAGDAFRAGLLKGLYCGESLVSSCRLGSASAVFCVEAPGTQEHSFTLAELKARYYSVFKESLNI